MTSVGLNDATVLGPQPAPTDFWLRNWRGEEQLPTAF
jgi:hypothetical protein